MPRKLRAYEPIWLAIKKAPFGTEVEVRVHKTMERTVILCVRKEKTMAVAPMRSIGERTEGPLDHRVTVCPKNADFVIIHFKLRYNEKDV